MREIKRWTYTELARPDGSTITAKEVWLAITGVEAKDFRCRKCGKPPVNVNAPPAGVCRQPVDGKDRWCGTPLPRRCVSCSNINEPRNLDGYWVDPWPFCDDCENEQRREVLAETLRRVIPSQLRAAAKSFYHKASHRRRLVDALTGWLEVDKLGKAGGPSCVLAWGSRGSGKSVAASWLVGKALAARGVYGAQYVTEDDLLTAALGQFSDDKTKAHAAANLLASCRSTPLLVLDELGSGRALGYSPRETKETLRVLHDRLSERKPTVLVSNLAPTRVEAEGRDSFLGWLDERIVSRFEGNGLAIECTGPDMRIS